MQKYLAWAASVGSSVAGVQFHDALVDVGLGDVDLGLGLGEHELGVLEVGDRLAERLAFADVLDGPTERGSGRRDAGDGDRQAFLGEVGREVVESLALLAEQVGGGDAHVVEEQFGGVLAVQADLLEIAAAFEAGHPALDDEQRHAAVALASGRSWRRRSPGRR